LFAASFVIHSLQVEVQHVYTRTYALAGIQRVGSGRDLNGHGISTAHIPIAAHSRHIPKAFAANWHKQETTTRHQIKSTLSSQPAIES